MSRRKICTLFTFAVLISLVSVAAPFFSLYPFRSQTRGLLETAFQLRRFAPILTLICLAIELLLTITFWKRFRLMGKSFSVFFLLITTATAWFSQQNYFEWFFHPNSDPGYVSIDNANFLTDSDMVLAINIRGEAVAYPVSFLAYHHLVNDTVGGVPVVATY